MHEFDKVIGAYKNISEQKPQLLKITNYISRINAYLFSQNFNKSKKST